MNILVTGSAGFIGASLSRKLIHEGFRVIGVDNVNKYYSVDLKKDRLREIKASAKFGIGEFKEFTLSIENINELEKLFINYPSLRLENLEPDKLSLIFE